MAGSTVTLDGALDLEQIVTDLLAAILRGDRAKALELVSAVLPHGMDCLYERVITPALVRVGELWFADQITIAEEHLAFALVQSTVAALYPSLVWPVGGPLAVVACVEGERHELGARMVADLLALDGWNAIFLGGDVPAAAFVEMLERKQVKLAVLSVCLPMLLPSAQRVIALVRAKLPHLPILLGGRAISASASPKELDVQAIARSASEGVKLARKWKVP